MAYSQKKNDVSKGIKKIVIDMTKAMILKYNINNDL